jgi:hypothetical protein
MRQAAAPAAVNSNYEILDKSMIKMRRTANIHNQISASKESVVTVT